MAKKKTESLYKTLDDAAHLEVLRGELRAVETDHARLSARLEAGTGDVTEERVRTLAAAIESLQKQVEEQEKKLK